MASSNQGSEHGNQPSGNQDKDSGQGANRGSNGQRNSNRGFASMDAARQRAIASEGGKAAHLSGNAHQFTSEEARVAGRKGGQAGGGNRGSSGNR